MVQKRPHVSLMMSYNHMTVNERWLSAAFTLTENIMCGLLTVVIVVDSFISEVTGVHVSAQVLQRRVCCYSLSLICAECP